MADKGRIARFKKGLQAERYARFYLMLKGYRILEQRYKTPVGEIDLIARRGKVFVFIEVKARRDITKAIESITPHQRRRIERAASLYASRLKSNPPLRFDAVLVAGWKLRHIVSAWRYGE